MTLPESILELIYRTLSGDADEAECRHLAELLKNDPELAAEFQAISRLWQLGKYSGKWEKITPDAAWKRIVEKRKIQVPVRKRHAPFWGIAAVMLLLISIAASVLFVSSEKDQPEQIVEVIKSGEAKAQLILASGKKIELGSYMPEKIQELGAVINGDTALLVYQKNEQLADAGMKYNKLIIPRGGEYRLQLSDGSVVFLNSDSRLKYPVVFSQEKREVYLEGEAYFEVSPDENHPFVVHTSGLSVNVLGTGFNVMAYRNEERAEVTLVHGKVRVKSAGGNAVLRPDEQLVYHYSTNNQTIHQVMASKYVSWTEGVLAFDGMSLEELTNKLSRWYDVEFFFTSEQLKTLKFTGAFMKYNDIQYVLSLIGETTDVRFILKNRTVSVIKK